MKMDLRQQKGYSMIEMAVVLAIGSLLLVPLAGIVASQIRRRRLSSSRWSRNGRGGSIVR